MKLNVTHYFSTTIRYKLAEVIVSNRIKGILTTKYPPDVLETEFFDELPQNEKDFLKKYWNTFDIFKPIFEIIDELPSYNDFVLYEVKSKVITEKNKGELETPTITISENQQQFLDECKDLKVAVKFFLVFFRENWEVEYKEFDIDKVTLKVCPKSAWNEERIKRIKSSRLNQFWHDLFPDRVLYKVDEKELDAKELRLQEVTRTPLKKFEKEMLIERAKKRNKPIPKFLETVDETDDSECKNIKDIRTEYHKRLEKIKEQFPNAYEPWEQDDDNTLNKLYSENKPINELAQLLKRRPSAIKSRLRKQG